MTRSHQIALALGASMIALALIGPRLAPRDPLDSIDAAALSLLPPGASVTALVRQDGSPIPVSGYVPGRPDERLTEWRVEGDTVVYRRGARERRVALSELQTDVSGRPRTTTLRFWAGTDRFGRDLMSRLLAGARWSLGIGLFGVVGATLLAAIVGLGASLAGRFGEGLLGRIGDGVLSVPRIVLVMALAALVEPGPWVLAPLLALTGWASLARLVRADVRALIGSDMVASARAAGAGSLRVAARHVLPHTLGTLLVGAGLRVGPFILLEASLSFLGFGVPPPYPSWGNILADGRDVLLDAWWVTALPGVLLVVSVVCVNAAADALRAFFEPRRQST